MSYSQDSTEQKTPQVKQKYMFKRKDKGGYFGLTFGATSIDSVAIGNVGFRFMSITNRWMSYGLVMGGSISGAVEYEKNKYTYPGLYVGLQINPILFPRWIIHFSLPGTIGGGWTGKYEILDNTTNFEDQTYFLYAEGGVELELNMGRKFRISFGGYYTYRYNLPEISTMDPQISNYSLNLNLKWGNFGFINRY